MELMQHIPDKSVDMILCDLPYGVTAMKWDNILPIKNLWNEYERIIKPNGAIVLFCQHVFEYDIFNCPQELKGQLKIGDFSC